MSEAQLRSAISDLNREISRLERENSQMRSEINGICNSAMSAESAFARSGRNAVNVLNNSSNIINYANSVMEDIIEEQEHIEYLYQGFKNIETANKKIRELNNQIYYQFSTFRTVRKIVRAFIDNITLDMVNSELIYKSLEKEHLQSPDFWLSCCMLAVMHWKEDNRGAAERAIDKALELNEKNSVLFFMSFNLLVDRKEAAYKWFERYISLDKTGSDSSFILLLLHSTNLREASKDFFSNKIKEYLMEEYAHSCKNNNIDELTELVKNHLIQVDSRVDSESKQNYTFDSLRSFVKDYPTMARSLNMAKNNISIKEFVEETNISSRDRGYIYIEHFLNELLDKPDDKEKAFTNEILYNEMIIKHTGDIANAQKEYDERITHDESELNLLSECINWLFCSSSSELSDLAKGNIFILCKDIIKDAAERYFSEYRSLNKNIHPVTIRDYSTNMDMRNKNAEIAKAENFYEGIRSTILSTIKNTSIIVCAIIAALTFAGGIATMLIEGLGTIGAILFVVSAIMIISSISSFFKNKKRRKEVEEAVDKSIANIKNNIDAIFDEFQKFQGVFKEYDAVSEEILFAIDRE